VTKTFPYTISDSRRELILAQYSQLKLGMTKQDVLTILGEPDFTGYLHSKQPQSRYLGSRWMYYFYKADSSLVNERLDKSVQVFFSPDDKVSWVRPKNVPGLAEIGRPKQDESGS